MSVKFKLFIPTLLFPLLFILSFTSHAQMINVYLKYQEENLYAHIQQFNHFLDSHNIFTKYAIKPFLGIYPLHTTLYLTDYEEENITSVSNSIAMIVKQTPTMTTSTGELMVSAGNYVMLDVKLDKQTDGQNHSMQQLSDKIVAKLQLLRNTKAEIPDWARNIPIKREAFSRYGSPNVFFEFSPHFTLMAKNFNNTQVAKQFHDEITQLINIYTQNGQNRSISLNAIAIGVGFVNDYGQVTEEIASYPLLHTQTGY